MSVSESTALSFVPIEPKHIHALLEIESEAYPEPWTEGMFREEARSYRSHFYVVFMGDLIIGYGGFWLVLDEAHITSVTIRNEYRGIGYGRRLLDFLLAKAVEVGARMATLEVRVSNHRARVLYERAGFRPVGLRKNYYPKTGEDAVVMLKELE
ncbi:MAG: ribosomal protein S18-alanine N-acetyltransferase [Candidatus Hydrogenedentes bacterium]|nr:ribosomal protein S18-alanine N-acetyltransferase [Candidatus Hydrogenedentota bacterium]